MRRTIIRYWLSLAVVAIVSGCAAPPSGERAGLAKIEHIVVIYAENRSFDNLYGAFPGASGQRKADKFETEGINVRARKPDLARGG